MSEYNLPQNDMTMTKLDKLIELIREGLEYAKPSEDGSYLIKLYENTLVASGFAREDIERCMSKLRENGIITVQQIFYAPHTTLSTYHPEVDTKAKATPDETFNKPVYYLHINVDKLQPKSDEPLSFNEDTGFIHFRGKKCKLPLKGIEYYVFKAMYAEQIGTRIPEDDIEHAIDLLNEDSKKVQPGHTMLTGESTSVQKKIWVSSD